MRQIKFRAFHPKEGLCSAKKMCELNCSLQFDGQILFDNYAFETGWVLMQYTGLKDYNGKELYHNDILWESVDNLYGEIVWIESAWAVEIYEAGEKVDTFVGSDFEQFCKFNHLAGNIYQNPELLNSSV